MPELQPGAAATNRARIRYQRVGCSIPRVFRQFRRSYCGNPHQRLQLLQWLRISFGTVILWLQLQPMPHDDALTPRAPGHPSVLDRSTVADVSVWHRTGLSKIHSWFGKMGFTKSILDSSTPIVTRHTRSEWVPVRINK